MSGTTVQGDSDSPVPFQCNVKHTTYRLENGYPGFYDLWAEAYLGKDAIGQGIEWRYLGNCKF